MELKYFVYMRVSNNDYEKSLEDQETMLKDLADTKKIPQKSLLIISETRSGSKGKKREKFDDMLDLLEKDIKQSKRRGSERKYGGILFWKIDRLARNYNDFTRLEELLDKGYKFISYSETIENTYTGRLLFRILGAFAIYESDKLSTRQSISKLHHLLEKKYAGLGGDITIFGYEYADEKQNIVIVNKEMNIIRKVYTNYIMEKQKNPKSKSIYTNIFASLDDAEQKYIQKYLKDNAGKKQTVNKFLGGVISNENTIKYHGVFSYTFNVKDELLVNYFNTIKKKQLSYESKPKISGDNIIGGKINFSMFVDDLAILPASLRDTAKVLYKNQGLTLEEQEQKNTRIRPFKDILHFSHRGVEQLGGTTFKKSKLTYNYRVQIGEQQFTVSELKLRDITYNFIDEHADFALFNTTYKEAMKGFIIKLAKKYEERELKSLTATVNIYNSMIEFFTAGIDGELGEISTDNIENYLQQRKIYLEKVVGLEKQKNILLRQQSLIVEAFMEGFSGELFESIYRKDVTETVRLKKKLVLKLLFKKIVYTRKDKEAHLEYYLLPHAKKALGFQQAKYLRKIKMTTRK